MSALKVSREQEAELHEANLRNLVLFYSDELQKIDADGASKDIPQSVRRYLKDLGVLYIRRTQRNGKKLSLTHKGEELLRQALLFRITSF